MKKIFTLFIALVAFSAVFAQRNTAYNNRSVNRWNNTSDNRNYNANDDFDDRSDHAIVITNDNSGYQYNNRRYNSYEKNIEMQRINRDYDRQINDYRYNRRLNAYERNRNIERLEQERRSKLKAFSGGVLVGGILGVLLGSNL